MPPRSRSAASPTTQRAPSPADVLGRVTLVTGKEEFLNERTVGAVKAAVRQHDGEAEVSDAAAGDLTMATLGELAAPSLFSTTRCVVVRGLENLPEESVAGLVEYAAAPAEDVALVLVHGGGQKGTGTLAKLRKLPAVNEVKSAELRAHELPRYVAGEARAAGASMDEEAADVLVQAVGADLRALSAAAHQLASDFAGKRIGVDEVGRYFGGRAGGTSFAVADHAFFGRRAQALEELRWAIDTGVAAVLVTSAFASGARGLAALLGAPRGLREADLAREVGVPPWKLRTLRDQARGWDEQSLREVVRAVARADAGVKGADGDPAYTLERLVLTVAGLRGR